MYIYIFHQFFYGIVFTKVGFGVVDFLLTMVACMAVGYILERIRNALFGKRPIVKQLGADDEPCV
jgi:vacuolar-type H+-ATPase subunit I/STV1